MCSHISNLFEMAWRLQAQNISVQLSIVDEILVFSTFISDKTCLMEYSYVWIYLLLLVSPLLVHVWSENCIYVCKEQKYIKF